MKVLVIGLGAALLAACATAQPQSMEPAASSVPSGPECASSRKDQRLNFDLAGAPGDLDAFAIEANSLPFDLDFGRRRRLSSGELVVIFTPATDPSRTVVQLFPLADKHNLTLKGPLIWPPLCSQEGRL